MTVETPPTTAMPAVVVDALCKSIDDRRILRDISLSIPAGSYVALLGANGAGKSTLLKILSTLTPASSGSLRIFSLPSTSPAVRSKLGLIGHQSMLYRDLTARENLEFFGKLYHVAHPKQRAIDLLDEVDLTNRADHPVRAFSRGMVQRLSIARALVHDPDLLLADEPFDGLDAPSSRALEKLLETLHRRGKTIILANHDIDQTLRLVERVVVLRAGRVVIDKPSWELSTEDVLNEMERRPS